MGSAGRNLHNAYNINRFRGDLLDGRFDGFNPSFGTITMVTSTSSSDYHGGTVALKRNFQQGVLLQGAYTFGRAMDDADAAVGTTAYQDAADIRRRPRGRRLRRHPQALDGRAVGAAVLQGRSTLRRKAARRLAARGLGHPPERVADQRRQQRRVSTRRLQRRRQRRRSAERPGRQRQAGRVEQGRIPGGHLPRLGLPDDPRPARTATSRATRSADRATSTSACRCRRSSGSQRWSGEFRLDAFNALNRVNLADPTMDLSNTNFGRVTSQLAPRAFQVGVQAAVLISSQRQPLSRALTGGTGDQESLLFSRNKNSS